LAVAAGVTVVAVASKHNLENVQRVGAKFAFDYNSPTVAEDVINALKGTDFVGICDCIGTEGAAHAWTPVYKALGGRYGTVMPQPVGVPDGIEGGPGKCLPTVIS
jgi:NADPH:quinone reductase-like Zn-dependent oxidoreductase